MISRKSLGSGKIFGRRVIFHVVEVPRIVISCQFANNWRRTFANIIEIPLVVLEKSMRLDFLNTVVT